jgi:MtrB/PioB family decaheme-associated outer membrane protein
MKRKNTVIALSALAAAISAAFAEDAPTPPPSGFTGSMTVSGIANTTGGQGPQHNLFRFEEYRDLSSGVTGGFDVNFNDAGWWNRLFGENIGRDDQYISLKGGKYGIFKYELYNDDIIHNTTFNAITPFNGVGTNRLTFIGASAAANLNNWNKFDYSVQHRNYGGFGEARASPDSPFYYRIEAKQKQSEGLRPLGAAGTSPGGPAYELAAPIDWTTTDVSGELGYSTKKMHLSVSYTYSKFEDNNKFLTWQTPLVTNGTSSNELSTIAMDNKLERIAANGVFRGLPLDSTLALRGTYTKTTSGFAIAPTFLSVSAPSGFDRLSGASQPNFTGEVVNESFSAAYNSHLAKGWDSKVYYNWYKRENNSSEIVFTPSGSGSGGTCDVDINAVKLTTCTTEFLKYRKNNAGLELYYRLNPDNRFAAGYDYLDTSRERLDFDQTTEQKLWLEWKSGMFEVVDLRLKYQHLNRTSNFLLGASTDVFTKYVYRFDAAPLDRDMVKLTLDGSPGNGIDLGVEFIYKVNKYQDTVLGRRKDNRGEVSANAGWGDMKVFRVSAFFDYEHTFYDSEHWVGDTTTFPTTNQAAGAYLWSSDIHDKNWLFGVAADWQANERLHFTGSYIWTKANGNVDFQAPAFANAQPITNYDNFTKQTLNLKGKYKATKQLDVTLGYAYERYDYSDIQMDDYIYDVKTGSNQNYLSGAYAYPNYRASIGYVYFTYHF